MSIGLRRLIRRTTHSLMRARLNLPALNSASTTFKLAQTKYEIEQALALMGGAGSEFGFPGGSTYRGRMPPHGLLPTTVKLIGLNRGRVIAACTLVRDDVLGLPMDSLFDLSKYRETGERLAEVSSFAIHAEIESERDAVFYTFMRFVWRYSLFYQGVNRLVIAVEPRLCRLYEAIFLFEADLPKQKNGRDQLHEKQSYVGMQTLLDDSMTRFKRVFGARKEKQNMFFFLALSPRANELYPKRSFYTVNDISWTPALIQYFGTRSGSHSNAVLGTTFARIHDAYVRRGLGELVGDLPGIEQLSQGLSTSGRCDVACPLRIVIQNDCGQNVLTENAVAFDASEHGMRVRLNSSGDVYALISRRLMMRFRATIELGLGRCSNLRLEVVWMSPHGHAGFQVIESDDEWRGFIEQVMTIGGGREESSYGL